MPLSPPDHQREQVAAGIDSFVQLAELLPELVWTTDNAGTQLFASSRWKEFTGVEPVNSGTFEQIVHPDDLHVIMKAWKDCMASGKRYSAELRLKRMDGVFEWFEAKGEPIRNEKGEIFQWVGVFSNINEKKKAAEQAQLLKSSEEKLDIIIRAGEIGTFELNLQTDSVAYSTRYLEIFGYHEKYLPTHKELLSRLHPADMEARNAAYAQALRTGILHYEARIVWEDGSQHWIEVKGKIQADSGEGVNQMIGTIRDITAEKYYQLELQESEAKFRLLADSLPQHIWTADLDGNLNYYNQSVFDYTGMSFEEINAKGWLEIVHPDDREENVRQWTRAVQTGTDFLFEHRFRRFDGEYRWQLSRAIPQKDKEGKIQMWVGTSTDIEDQKRLARGLEKQVIERTNELKETSQELVESEQRYHLMIDEVQDYAILSLNRNGEVQSWNKGAEKIKGYKSEEIIGRSFSTFYTKEDRDRDLPGTLLNKAIETGRATQEGWRVRKDGSRFWASVTITALHDKEGNTIGFSKVTRDLTEIKEAQDSIKLHAAQLERKNTELEKMNAELESFAYVSSHDLQEPLRKIQTFAGRIIENEQDSLSEKGRDYFRRMQDAASRMQILIEDLLTYSRTSTTDREFLTTDLQLPVAEVAGDFAEVLAESGGTIEVGALCFADVIPFQFRQMLHNLVSNAVKFSRPGEPPYVHIEAERKMGSEWDHPSLDPHQVYCHISIADKGIGFDPQYNERIFEVFQRLHGKNEYKGTGIGLAIVKKIVDNHNGVITATGAVNDGARFDIYLPDSL